jgi:predicted DCC family thiol-disulfide oxidoreductase YuxK
MKELNKTIVFFDGICVLCNASVRFIIKFDKQKHFYFATLQSDVAKEILLHQSKKIQQKDSILLWYKNKVYTESSAVLMLARILGGFFWITQLFWIIPKFIRDFFYKIVAKNRYKWFGKLDSCMVLEDESRGRVLR